MKKSNRVESLYLTEQALKKLYDDLSTGKKRLSDFPEKARTYNMCLCAVKFDGLQIIDVPKKYRTEEMINTAFGENIKSIKLVESKNIPTHAYLHAVIMGVISLEEVPKNKRNYEVCLYGVRRNGMNISLCPLKKFSNNEIETLYSTAVEATPEVIKIVPSYYRTTALYFSAIKKKPSLLTHIPLQDEYFYSEVVSLTPGAIYFVPEQFQTLSLYKDAVVAYGENLQYVPYDMRDEEMCKLAYQNATDKEEVEKHIPANILQEIKEELKQESQTKTNVSHQKQPNKEIITEINDDENENA